MSRREYKNTIVNTRGLKLDYVLCENCEIIFLVADHVTINNCRGSYIEANNYTEIKNSTIEEVKCKDVSCIDSIFTNINATNRLYLTRSTLKYLRAKFLCVDNFNFDLHGTNVKILSIEESISHGANFGNIKELHLYRKLKMNDFDLYANINTSQIEIIDGGFCDYSKITIPLKEARIWKYKQYLDLRTFQLEKLVIENIDNLILSYSIAEVCVRNSIIFIQSKNLTLLSCDHCWIYGNFAVDKLEVSHSRFHGQIYARELITQSNHHYAVKSVLQLLNGQPW